MKCKSCGCECEDPFGMGKQIHDEDACLGLRSREYKPQPAFDVRIEDKEEYGERVIRGYIGHSVIIQVSNGRGYWKVGSSTSLPTDIAKARQYVEVMRSRGGDRNLQRKSALARPEGRGFLE